MIFIVGTTGTDTKNWNPEIYKSAKGKWKSTAPHPYNFGYLGRLVGRVLNDKNEK